MQHVHWLAEYFQLLHRSAGAELIVVSAASRWESALSRGLGDVDGSLSNRSTIDSAAFSRAPSLMSSCHRLPAL